MRGYNLTGNTSGVCPGCRCLIPGREGTKLTNSADQPVISIRDLVMTFTDGDGRVKRVLDGVTFDIHRGDAWSSWAAPAAARAPCSTA